MSDFRLFLSGLMIFAVITGTGNAQVRVQVEQVQIKAKTAVTKRVMTVEDLFRFQRVSDPQVSPDGRHVVYAVSEITDSKANKSVSRLWIVPSDGSAAPRMLTNSAAKDNHPRWSPDGRWILFESSRSGSGQLWVISTEGGEAQQLTRISTDASSGTWSPDGKHIAFVSAVYPEFSEKPFAESDAANKKKAEEIAASPIKAKVFTKLFYRHWDSYVEDKRQHLFVIDVAPAPQGGLTASEPRDVTPGDRDANPTSSTFSAGADFSFSPDGTHLIFTAVPAEAEAWSTNHDLCRVPISGGTTEWEALTGSNLAADGLPVVSPDGKMLAWRSQRKPGYEADRWEVMLGKISPDGKLLSMPVSLTSELDLSFDEIVWRGTDRLLLSAESEGGKPVYQLAVSKPNVIEQAMTVGTTSSMTLSTDGKVLICGNARMTYPTEVFRITLMDEFTKTQAPGLNLSHANDGLLAELDLPQPESIKVEGADGDPMQMWILKPPGFDANQKWALGYLVHGGPQGAWADSWSFRWNPQIWAAQGYVVAAPNPRGSTGFGQKYTDQISGDWGGRCYEDLMAGLAHMEKQPWVDTDRMFSAGASFGGYMMNWFQGKTTKFKTLVTHCGVYNFDSMYATTEELWFDEYEHGGPPWGPNRESYEKHSPHRLAASFKTPMLIIHNDLDFRVPVSEGHQLFTTLQRLGVPSRFINFPDEGHWVTKPANSRFWHNEIFTWLREYCPPGTR
ncbi:MAG: S9 family peptidase [Planctomyces sp.]|nr:S9 family peptidase [Planctomyces sp.]